MLSQLLILIKKTNTGNEIVYLSNCKKYPQLEVADKVVETIDMFLKVGLFLEFNNKRKNSCPPNDALKTRFYNRM